MKPSFHVSRFTFHVSLLLGLAATARGLPDVPLASPGLAPSRLDAQGRLVEDWGALEVKLTGEGLTAPAAIDVQAVKLDQLIPAAQARSQHGPVACTLTVYRAPAWPAGLDVLTVRLEETSGRDTPLQLSLGLPENVRLGATTVSVGGRTVAALPSPPNLKQTMREWGWVDDATALPGWARPEGECDPAFRNIRAGLGGVPIHYRFAVEPRASFNVVLGFCESFWSQPGQRPVVCEVEGAKRQAVDPLAKWGQHKPGALLFAARDENGDARLDVSVLPHPGAPDLNPILNVIWLFPPGSPPNLEQVIAGKLNSLAARYVDVGGDNDQSLYAGGKVEYSLTLPAKGAQEMTFLVACPGASAPMPERTAWTPAKLRQAAVEVWRDWREK